MKYMAFNKTTDECTGIRVFDSSSDIQNEFWWDATKFYIAEFANDYDFTYLQNPAVVSTCTTSDNKDQVVTDFTIDYDATLHNAQVDKETFQLIKDWCADEEEGCEEAFINLGIDDNTDTRYQAYVTQKSSIKSSQSAKKIVIGTG